MNGLYYLSSIRGAASKSNFGLTVVMKGSTLDAGSHISEPGRLLMAETTGNGEDQRQVAQADLHPHLLARMEQRGVNKDEIERTLKAGWSASDTKPGTNGKVFVFDYQAIKPSGSGAFLKRKK